MSRGPNEYTQFSNLQSSIWHNDDKVLCEKGVTEELASGSEDKQGNQNDSTF